ncbi:hypothetical protein FRC20_006219 [Serendipita sp. 405]|nr:hypothetical protein FRC15_005702 [Serendipita sp. 397]KAG8838847.1 hypothetical protein FRC20_006219 [Serendipita sp. 405]
MWKASDVGLVHWYNSLWGVYLAVNGMSTDFSNGVNNTPAVSSWISDRGWAVGPFEVMPGGNATDFRQASNMTAILPAIQTRGGCEGTQIELKFIKADGPVAGWNATATGERTGCVHTREIWLSNICCDANGKGCCENWAGDVNACGQRQASGQPLDPSQQSFVYWTARMISNDTAVAPQVSVTICKPSYTIYRNSVVTLDSSTLAVLNVTPPTFTDEEDNDGAGGQVSPLLNGSTFNGFDLDWFHPAGDDIVGWRKHSIRTSLVSTINLQGVRMMENGSDPYVDASWGYTNITKKVYGRYMAHLARQLYFRAPDEETVRSRGARPSSSPSSKRVGSMRPSKTTDIVLYTVRLMLFVNGLMVGLSVLVLFASAIGVGYTAFAARARRGAVLPTKKEGSIATNAIAAQGVIATMMGPKPQEARYTLTTNSIQTGSGQTEPTPVIVTVESS